MNEINLNLSVEEVNGLLSVLAELPTRTGAWPLFLKVQEQAKKQLETQEDEAE